MAESSGKAFGRYLKILRERRNLSLSDVTSLSQTFPEIINKGYLSRCENGHQRLAFSKVIALSRIYEIPADVLVERMELDLELDHLGTPNTAGKSYDQLLEGGRKAIEEGYRWEAYGMLRDAIPLALSSPVRPNFRDHNEQLMLSFMSCATAARALDRYRFALHEYLFVRTTNVLGPKYIPILLERISTCYENMNQKSEELHYAELAIEAAKETDDLYCVGYVYGRRAKIASSNKEYDDAINYEQKAYKAHQLAGLVPARITSMFNLAQYYFDSNRIRAAQRTLDTAETLCNEFKQNRILALCSILRGDIAVRNKQLDVAKLCGRTALSLAKKTKDRRLKFRSELFLFKIARAERNLPVGRAIERRLIKLAPWLSKNTPEVREFQHLIS